MQKSANAAKTTNVPLLHKAMAYLLSLLLMLSYSSIAYALDEDETTEATATEEQTDSSSVSTDETVSSEEATDTEETEEAETEETSDSDDTTDDAVSLEVPTISALSEVSLLNSVAANVAYIDEDGSDKTATSATIVDNSTTTWSDGWYVVNSTVEITDRITVSGDVHLILADNATLTASAGISVNEGNSLTIYAQSTEEGTMGSLIATAAAQSYAGIGGDSNNSNGAITINGGNITATGGQYGAGIGGGGLAVNDDSNVSENITISGGTVTATGGRSGAGIGTGCNGSAASVIITGGTVTATGSRYGSGIGLGGRLSGTEYLSSSLSITITGGTVNATASSGDAAGIGGGATPSDEVSITITGGTVTATGTGTTGTGIGGCSIRKLTVTITGGTVIASGNYMAIGTYNDATDAREVETTIAIKTSSGYFCYRTSESGDLVLSESTDNFSVVSDYLAIYPAAAPSSNAASSTSSTSGTSASSSTSTSATSASSTSASTDTSDASSILPKTGDSVGALLPVIAAVALGACAVAVRAAFALRKRCIH